MSSRRGSERGARRLLLAALALAPLAGCATRPDWRLARTVDDGYRAPLYVHQGARALGGVGAYTGLRVARVSRPVAGPLGAFASGVFPHAVGVAAGWYPFDRDDWVADAVNAGGPSLVAQVCEGRVRSWTCGAAAALQLLASTIASGWAR